MEWGGRQGLPLLDDFGAPCGDGGLSRSEGDRGEEGYLRPSLSASANSRSTSSGRGWPSSVVRPTTKPSTPTCGRRLTMRTEMGSSRAFTKRSAAAAESGNWAGLQAVLRVVDRGAGDFHLLVGAASRDDRHRGPHRLSLFAPRRNLRRELEFESGGEVVEQHARRFFELGFREGRIDVLNSDRRHPAEFSVVPFEKIEGERERVLFQILARRRDFQASIARMRRRTRRPAG